MWAYGTCAGGYVILEPPNLLTSTFASAAPFSRGRERLVHSPWRTTATRSEIASRAEKTQSISATHSRQVLSALVITLSTLSRADASVEQRT